MAFLIEVIVELRVNRAEYLQRPRTSKTRHCSFSPPKWLMRDCFGGDRFDGTGPTDRAHRGSVGQQSNVARG
jgi:hypothetical protein